ncbi:putative RNA methyltransferase [Jatrophihabitans sp.]|uniref:putative RNA methyltransferase n=1 Tax=Jatrophihabitans sp. TaxID=1932789 RepID=UPI002BC47E3D|nr:hypothetical protein [Jatrophihabitans sp.]
MNTDTLKYLKCPVCHAEGLRRDDNAVKCVNSHAFNVARQGYIDLLLKAGKRPEGDSLAMVEARARFLASGTYAPIADLICRTAIPHLRSLSVPTPVCLDLGGGTGYYLDALRLCFKSQNITPSSILGDVSIYAARRAARILTDTLVVRMDTWQQIPLVGSSVDVGIIVFAPRNAIEIARVMRDTGRLLVVTPAEDHLAGVMKLFGVVGQESNKREHLLNSLSPYFHSVESNRLRYEVTLTRDQALDVLSMGPNARHIDIEDVRSKLHALNAIVTLVDVYLDSFAPNL